MRPQRFERLSIARKAIDDGDVAESRAQFSSVNLAQASEFIREAWKIINNLYSHLAIFLGALTAAFYAINSDWLKEPITKVPKTCKEIASGSGTFYCAYTYIEIISGLLCIAGLLGCLIAAAMLHTMAMHARRFLNWASLTEAYAVMNLAGVDSHLPTFWNTMRLQEVRGYDKYLNLINFGMTVSLIFCIPWISALYFIGRRIINDGHEFFQTISLGWYFIVPTMLGWCALEMHRRHLNAQWRVEMHIYNTALLKHLNLEHYYDLWKAGKFIEEVENLRKYLNSDEFFSNLLTRNGSQKGTGETS